MAIAEVLLKVVLSPSYLNNTMFTIYCDADVCIDINKSKKINSKRRSINRKL